MAGENIPATDPALLAAQNQAGPAGVAAYQAAKEELARTQQSSLGAAMQGAQARGGPTGGMDLALGEAANLYQRRQDSMTQAQARAQTRDENQINRMNEYTGAIGEARGLIKDQVQQVLAPMRQQSDFSIRQLQQEGENKVGQIRSQAQLDAARFAAELRAAEQAARLEQERWEREMAQRERLAAADGSGDGAGKLGSLTGGELLSMMSEGAQSKISAILQTASSQLAAKNKAGEQAHRELQSSPWKIQAGARSMLPEADVRRVGGYETPGTAARSLMSQSVQPDREQQVRAALSAASAGVTDRVNFGRGPTNMGQNIARTADMAERQIRAMPATTNNAQNFEANSHRFQNQYGLAEAAYKRDTESAYKPTGFSRDEQRAQVGGADGALWSYLMDEEGNSPTNEAEIEAMIADDPDFLRDAMRLAAQDLAKEGYDISDAEVSAALGYDEGYDYGSTYRDLMGETFGMGNVAEQEEKAHTDQTRLWAEEDRARQAGDREVDLQRMIEEDAAKNKTAQDEANEAAWSEELTGMGVYPGMSEIPVPIAYSAIMKDPEGFQRYRQYLMAQQTNVSLGKRKSWDDIRKDLITQGLNPSNITDDIQMRLLEGIWND